MSRILIATASRDLCAITGRIAKIRRATVRARVVRPEQKFKVPRLWSVKPYFESRLQVTSDVDAIRGPRAIDGAARFYDVDLRTRASARDALAHTRDMYTRLAQLAHLAGGDTFYDIAAGSVKRRGSSRELRPR